MEMWFAEKWTKRYGKPDCLPKHFLGAADDNDMTLTEFQNEYSYDRCLPTCNEEHFTMTRARGDLDGTNLNRMVNIFQDSLASTVFLNMSKWTLKILLIFQAGVNLTYTAMRFYFQSFDYNEKIIYQETLSEFLCRSFTLVKTIFALKNPTNFFCS